MVRAKEVMLAALLGQEDRLYEATIRSMDMSTDGMPPTLLHGDCHAGRTYMTAAGGMGIADWQAVLQGGWAFDGQAYAEPTAPLRSRRRISRA